MSGFIVVRRDAFKHPVLRDGERFKAFFWMVAQACWKATPFDINGRIVTLNRGQFCTSRSALAKEWGWSPSAVERFLTRLKTEHMIEQETGQGRSIITISNYSRYQDTQDETGQAPEQANGQRSDSDRTAKEQTNHLTNIKTPNPFPKPEWADQGLWKDFLANRKTRKMTNTAGAFRKFEKDIETLSDEEWPPGRLLEHAVAHGWAAIHDPRKPMNGQTHQANGHHNPQDDYLQSVLAKRSAEKRSDLFGD